MSGRASRFTVTVAATVALVLAVGVVTWFAVRSPGYATAAVQTTQRAAWVSSDRDLMVGLLNRQTDQVQSPAYLDSAGGELLQQDDAVVVVDHQQHSLRKLDPTDVVFSAKLTIPAQADVAISTTTIAVSDLATGRIWTIPQDSFDGGDLADGDAAATAAPGALVTVIGTRVVAAAPGSPTVTVIDTDSGAPRTSTVQVPGGPLSALGTGVEALQTSPIQLSSVGDVPVILDRTAHRLVVIAADGARSIDLGADTSTARLQQPGPAASTALVATGTALVSVALSTGAIDAQQVTGTTSAADPVRVGNCVHAAWAGATPTYLTRCDGGPPSSRPIGSLGADSALVFRVNRETVVLNDVTSGNSWVLDDTMTLVNNWDQIRSSPADLADSDTGTQGSANKLTAAQQPCTDKPVAPAAKDDKYGVRPGHPRVLQVLDNDQTSTCSVPLITSIQQPEVDGLQAQVVDGGSAIQVILPATRTTPVTVGYTISDGLSGTSDAAVTITPVTAVRPAKPTKVRESTAAMTVRGTIAHRVLGDWDSPSGDPLFLVGARSSVPSDRVSYSADGTITLVDSGATGASKKAVTYQVSDGVNTVEGTLSVEVVDEADASPVAGPVHASGAVGEQLVIDPLRSVLWPGQDELGLAKVTPQKGTSGLAVTPDTANGTVTVVGARPGSYYLDYQVAVGDKSSTGVIRVDVAAADAQRAPIAMTDVTYLPQGGESLVDLTANDLAPSGGIVAVQDISVPAGSGIVARLTDMHLVQLSARRALPATGVWISYAASAGGGPATGWLHVVPVPRPAEPLSPTADSIAVSVRAGDAVTIPIHAHAVDPGGDAIVPVAFPDDAIAAGEGLLFVTDESLRYQAPSTGAVAEGRTLRTQYTVRNTFGKSASANLTITVVPRGENRPPRTPPTVQARVFVGGSVDIPVPLTGVDPDGDWAILGGVDEQPQRGAASVSGASVIKYTAFDQAGTDTLRYTASDPFGGTVMGTVQVLVVPLPDSADPPIVPDLAVTVAPGRSIAVNVLGEVTDPGGLAVSFPAENALQLPAGSPGITVRTRDDTVLITAGSQPVTVPIQVTVQNAQQRTGSGTLTVTVDPQAPAIPPTADDILVTTDMVNDAQDTATVDLSPAVANPGGLPEELVAGVPALSKGRLSVLGERQVTVPVTTARQVIAYQVTTPQQLTAEAFLIVPSRSELGIVDDPGETTPQPEPEPAEQKPFVPRVLKPLVVDAGQTYSVKVADHIGGAAAGRTVQVSSDVAPRASVGTLTRLDAATLRWVVPEDAGGGAQLIVPVSDGATKVTQASIRATIRPKNPDPPVFQGTSIEVEAGASAPPVKLLPLVTYDPDKKADLRFSAVNGGANGITAVVRDGSLVVSAAIATPKGTTTTFSMTVTDGINPQAAARFPVTVTGSDKPLATLAPKRLDAAAGQQAQTNVLAGASNPFPEPLTLTAVGDGVNYATSFDANGVVRITPAADFSGTLAIPLTVQDVTADPDRAVSGTLTVVVRGKPDAPGAPGQLSVDDGTAVIQWGVPDDNGSAITSYLVRGSGGFSQECPRSPCRLEGLRNNVSYVFTVVARNDVGESAASAGSAPVRPDTAPSAPGTPKLTYGDATMVATWPASSSSGSPITKYEVQISPGRSVTVGADTRSHRFDGLQNGTTYTVRVRALNNSGSPSDFSPQASETPAGKPGVPRDLQITAARTSGDRGQIDVTWGQAAGNGDAPSYIVSWRAGGATRTMERPVGATAAAIPDVVLGQEYSIQVYAVNKVGRSALSEPKTVRPYTPPARVTDLAATATGADGEVKLAWSAPADNGREIVKYQYTATPEGGGANWQDTPGTDTTFNPPNLTNGTAYTFQVRACSQTDQGVTCGEDSPGAAARPYGPPRAVQNLAADPNAPGAGNVNVSWQPPADTGGRGITGYDIKIDGGGWADNGAATTYAATGLNNGQTYTFTVRAKNNQGQPGAETSVQATPYDRPAPPGLTATPGENAVTLTWADGGNGGNAVTGYQWDRDGANNWQPLPTNTNTQTFPIAGDWANHNYQVRAINARGASDPSAPAPAKAWGPVGQVRDVAASENANSVDYSWGPPEGNGVDGWTYQVDGNNVGDRRTATRNGSCQETLKINVVATDAQGHSGPAREISGKTTATCESVQIVRNRSAVGHTGTSPGSTTCNHSSCRYIDVQIGGFPDAKVSCSWVEIPSTYSPSRQGNGLLETQWYYGNPGGTVTVECSGGGKTKRESITW